MEGASDGEPNSAAVVTAGWLWKSGASRFSRWRRRWFVLRADATLAYYTSDGACQSPKGVLRLSATRVVLSHGSRRNRQRKDAPVLHLYTARRTYHFEADGSSEGGIAEFRDLRRWASFILEASGRKGREFAAAKRIRVAWEAYRASPQFGMNPTTAPLPNGENQLDQHSALSHPSSPDEAFAQPSTSPRPTSLRDSNSRATFNFESQAKLLLQRPRTGAASILGRSRIVRNRGLCWQVLLGCAEYIAEAPSTGMDSDPGLIAADNISPTVLYSRNWELTARRKHRAYQRRLIDLSKRLDPNKDIRNHDAECKGEKNANPFTATSTTASDADRQVAFEDPLSAASGHKLQLAHDMAELRREIWNDVNRTFPEDPLFQLPRVRAIMRRILLVWCLSEDNAMARRIGYRQGMNSLLAVLVLVHVQDAEAKGRALRCHLTGALDISLANRVHAELLRSAGYRFPTQMQREELERKRNPKNLATFLGEGAGLGDNQDDDVGGSARLNSGAVAKAKETERRCSAFRSFRHRPAGWLLKPDFKRNTQITSTLAGSSIKRKLRQAKEVLTGEVFHKRWFFLHPESKRLYYFRDSKHAKEYFVTAETTSPSALPATLLPLGSIDLSKVTALRESAVEDAPFGAAFAFDLLSLDRKWTLSAESESACSCWVHAIVTALNWEDTLGPDVSHTRSSHLRRKSSNTRRSGGSGAAAGGGSSGSGGSNNRVDGNEEYENEVQSENERVRNSLLVVESTEMAESQCLESLRGLLGTVRNSSVGRFSVCELFDYYAEGDTRARATGMSRFQREAARTFVGARSSAAVAEVAMSKLPLLRLCEHVQYVILKNVDPELYRHFHSMRIEPQIYGLKWLRCLFSNVLTAVDFQDEEEEEDDDDGIEDDEAVKEGATVGAGAGVWCKPVFSAANRGPPPDHPLKHVLTVWDAMLGCRDRLFDFVESFCIALLVAIRTPLLAADANETLVLLMRYSLTTACQTRLQDAKRILGVETAANVLGSVDSAVSGLVEVAMQLVAQDDWPNAGGAVSVQQLMQTWIEPVSLQFESSKVRSLVSERHQRAVSATSSTSASLAQNFQDLDGELKSVLTLEETKLLPRTSKDDGADVREEDDDDGTGKSRSPATCVPLRGASGGYGTLEKEAENDDVK